MQNFRSLCQSVLKLLFFAKFWGWGGGPLLSFCSTKPLSLLEHFSAPAMRGLKKMTGFVEHKDNRAPPLPHRFCKNYLYEGIDLETWNLACDTLVPSLVQEKYEIPPRTPPSLSFFIFAKNRKNFISRFSARRSRKKVWYHKIKIVGKVHIWLTRKNFSPIGWRV